MIFACSLFLNLKLFLVLVFAKMVRLGWARPAAVGNAARVEEQVGREQFSIGEWWAAHGGGDQDQPRRVGCIFPPN